MINEQLLEEIEERKVHERLILENTQDLALLNELNELSNKGYGLNYVIKTLRNRFKEIYQIQEMTVYLLSTDKKYLNLMTEPIDNAILKKIEKLVGIKIGSIRILLAPGSLYHKIIHTDYGYLFTKAHELNSLIKEHANNPDRFTPRVQKQLKKLAPVIRKSLGQKSLYARSLKGSTETIGIISVSSCDLITESQINRYENVCNQLTTFLEGLLARERLKESYEDLRRMAGHLESVREEERLNIAREIHDELGQILTVLRLDLNIHKQNLENNIGKPALRSFLDDTDSLIGIVDKSIKTVRKISSELRSEILEDLGIVATIEWYLDDFKKRSGIHCVLYSEIEMIKLVKQTEHLIFRIFQEIFTNILRHANASEIEVKIISDSDGFILEVRDNGKGINEKKIYSKETFGITGMRERALLAGGELSISGKKNEGTMVTLQIPY
jgi:signal transduction histidine kinase